MIIVLLIVLGLAMGSFINAVVWRLRQQQLLKKTKAGRNKKATTVAKTSAKALSADELSIVKGRSMCPHCHHRLYAKDLVPLLSWIELGGRCRYCSAKIGWQYPVIELITAGLFSLSYLSWPTEWGIGSDIIFGLWLAVLTGLIALTVYDLTWMRLPDRLNYPVSILAAGIALVRITQDGWSGVIGTFTALLATFGLFWLLFQVSKGRWIGGGDVKLAITIGLLLPDAKQAFLMLFTASVGGSIVSLPLLVSKRLRISSRLAFGPFLATSTFIVFLYGDTILNWYSRLFLSGL